MRALQPAAVSAIAGKTVTLALLVEMDFDEGPLYLNHGRNDLVIDGKTYLGTYGLGQVGEAANQGNEMPKLAFSLSCASSDKLALALSEQVQGRPVRIKVALFDTATGAVLDVSLRYSGNLDVMTVEDGPDKAIVSVTSEAGVRDLLRPSNVLYTHVDQQAISPGDMFYQYINAQLERKIVFPARHWFIAHPEKA